MDESDFDDDCDDEPSRKKGPSHPRRREDCRWISRRYRGSDQGRFYGDSSTALSKRLNESGGRVDFDSGDDKCSQKRCRSRLWVVRQLNELVARATDYCEYKVVSDKSEYCDLYRHVTRFWKKADIQMRPHDFSESDPIAVLSFLARFKNACKLNCVPESIAVCCFQFYVKAQAE